MATPTCESSSCTFSTVEFSSNTDELQRAVGERVGGDEPRESARAPAISFSHIRFSTPSTTPPDARTPSAQLPISIALIAYSTCGARAARARAREAGVARAARESATTRARHETLAHLKKAAFRRKGGHAAVVPATALVHGGGGREKGCCFWRTLARAFSPSPKPTGIFDDV